MRVLLVEDDPQLGDALEAGLTEAGWAVDWVRTASAAEAALGTGEFDAVVLDIGLPDGSGLELLAGLRRAGSDVPVLILTARDSVEARVRGLDRGADDYMAKPFAMEELRARLRALRRRELGRRNPLIARGDLVLDTTARTVTVAGRPVELPNRELAVLALLLENLGRVVPRRTLVEHLYRFDDAVGSNTVEVYVHHLRARLGADLIRTVRGAGYVIDPDEG